MTSFFSGKTIIDYMQLIIFFYNSLVKGPPLKRNAFSGISDRTFTSEIFEQMLLHLMLKNTG